MFNIKLKNKGILSFCMIMATLIILTSCSKNSEALIKIMDSVQSDNIYKQTCIKLFPELPIITDKEVDINSDTLEELKFEINDINTEEQQKYIEECKKVGYTIDAISNTDSYTGFSQNGFKLETKTEENKLTVLLIAPMKMTDVKFKEDGLYKLIPEVATSKGNIVTDEKNTLEVYFADMPKDKYLSYVNTCIEKGFNRNVEKTDVTYKGQNKEDYIITVKYEGFNQIYIKVEAPVYKITLDCKCVANWIFSQYDLKIYIGDEYIGTLEHGKKDKYEVDLVRGTYKIVVKNAENSDISETFEFNAVKNDTIKLEFSCYSTSIDMKVNSVKKEEKANKKDSAEEETAETIDGINPPYHSYTSANYKSVVNAFKEAGFKNVVKQPIYDLGTGWLDRNSNGDTENISIAGNNKFDEDDYFDKNDKVIVKYHTWEWSNPKIKWLKRSVSKMVDELESNAMRAEKTYKDKYVKVTGRINTIDNSGDSFTLYPSNDEWALQNILCSVDLEPIKEKLINYSKGDIVTVKGKIALVGETLGYSMKVYGISK